MTTDGEWFQNNFNKYNPWKAMTVDALVCHEVGTYIGGYENSVEDGEYDRFPLTRKDALNYAYTLYMDNLPKGMRYQTKKYYEDLAERVVKGCEEAWGTPDWLGEDEEVVE